MSLCEAWKESMICWVTASELPGLLDQKVISLAGVILDQSVASEEAAAAPPPLEVLGLGGLGPGPVVGAGGARGAPPPAGGAGAPAGRGGRGRAADTRQPEEA